MSNIIPFREALRQSDRGAKRTLLLGNGFSIAQGGDRFSYSNLLEKSGLPQNSPVRRIFDTLETVDFEIVMKALEDAALIEKAYGDQQKAEQFSNDAAAVREALIRAVQAVHPGVHFAIPRGQREACGKFLSHFDAIFTVNYDLLLYWVILGVVRERFQDGFMAGETVDGFRTFDDRRSPWNTYYLHGALHLFVTKELETRKRVLTGSTIVTDIADTIRASSKLPLIVSEGTSAQKLSKIRSTPYLYKAFERIEALRDSLIIFGLGVSENDAHIYDAICRSGLRKVFYCVHDPAQRLNPVREDLARYAERQKEITWYFVDAATAPVWG
jgi:hypothetical protein